MKDVSRTKRNAPGTGPTVLYPGQEKALRAHLIRNGQALLPMLELIEQSKLAVDELIDVMGRTCIEAVLELSAVGTAGERHPGKRGGEIVRHGSQRGSVTLSDRKLGVDRPRLRVKGAGRGGEVEIPAYAAMQGDGPLRARMADLLMRGVSTRNYAHVIDEMADTAGVRKSSVSREFIVASAEKLRSLLERRFDERTILIVYIDGLIFAKHHVLAAVGVDDKGDKHVLGMREGASENGTVATELLQDIAARGVGPERTRLFVIDGSKALRKAIDAVYGERNPVQRCRQHKVRNVADHLPEPLRDQVKSVMRAAYKLPHREGIARLRQQAAWLAREHPSAAESLLEGLDETFTVNRLDLSPSLRRCLGSTNVIESPNSGIRQKTRRVTNWQSGDMVLRWAATALLATETHFRRLMGYKDLWMLKAALDAIDRPQLASQKEAA